MVKFIAVLASLLSSLGSSIAPAHADGVDPTHYYANQTPYGDPETTPVRIPPPGYKLIFLENVGRHGSRSQTSDAGEKRAYAVWRSAASRQALTTTGQRFDDDLRTFQAAEKSIGYGELSALGKAEWKGIGRRTAVNYADFWSRTAATGDDVAFSSSPVHRTKTSAAALRSGLDENAPRLDLKARTTDRRLLISSGATKAGNAATAQIQRRSDVRAAAKRVLRRLYTPSYVEGLADPVGKALDIYALYAIAPGMRGETSVSFDRYIPLEDARLLGYAKDAQTFYRYGPGVAGESSSYRQAKPVLADFFADLDARVAGGKTAVVFRLGHGETTMPFAALIKAPGSQKQAPRSTPFSYSTNPWRGYTAGRMAGSLEWAAYRNAAGKILVTMRYNERPVKFRSSCTPSGSDPYFYRVSTLKNCLL
jgi:hypothetical protein